MKSSSANEPWESDLHWRQQVPCDQGQGWPPWPQAASLSTYDRTSVTSRGEQGQAASHGTGWDGSRKKENVPYGTPPSVWFANVHGSQLSNFKQWYFTQVGLRSNLLHTQTVTTTADSMIAAQRDCWSVENLKVENEDPPWRSRPGALGLCVDTCKAKESDC